jgi:hypothetical protein
MPAGEKDPGSSLLSLVADFGYPPSAPPALPEGPLQLLPSEAYRSARLEPGAQDGVSWSRLQMATTDKQYRGGEKQGVKEAEARRRVGSADLLTSYSSADL